MLSGVALFAGAVLELTGAFDEVNEGQSRVNAALERAEQKYNDAAAAARGYASAVAEANQEALRGALVALLSELNVVQSKIETSQEALDKFAGYRATAEENNIKYSPTKADAEAEAQAEENASHLRYQYAELVADILEVREQLGYVTPHPPALGLRQAAAADNDAGDSDSDTGEDDDRIAELTEALRQQQVEIGRTAREMAALNALRRAGSKATIEAGESLDEFIALLTDEERALAAAALALHDSEAARDAAAQAADDQARALAGIENALLSLAPVEEQELARLDAWREEMLLLAGDSAELAAAIEDAWARMRAARLEGDEDGGEDGEEVLGSAGEAIAAGLRDYAAEGEDAMEALRDATQNAAQSMEDAFVEFATTGKLEVGSLVDAILADFARLAIRQHITGPLTEGLADNLPAFLGSLFGGGTTPVSPGAPGHIFHAGGIAGAPGGVARHGLPPWLWAGAPRYHSGGVADLRPDEVPVIVQRGEGIFTPEQMRALGTASTPVRVEIVNRGTPQRAVSAEAARGPDMAELVVSIIADDIAQGGHVGRRVTELAGGNY